ncbi:MAG: hypothetical protein PF542_02825 [Nanoarchaeota archaeon]|nr:hypothetical protein [Nanoarchaeota archaeon]
MSEKCGRWLTFLFGAFLIVFTFVNWSASKWIVLAAGIIMVLHSLSGHGCCSKGNSKVEAVKKPVVKGAVKNPVVKKKTTIKKKK